MEYRGGREENSLVEPSTKGGGKQRSQTGMVSCHISQCHPGEGDWEDVDVQGDVQCASGRVNANMFNIEYTTVSDMSSKRVVGELRRDTLQL